jgi:hypothetical protein
MYIGVYLCLSGLAYGSGLVLLLLRERKVARFSILTWGAAILLLLSFELASIVTGLVPYREDGSFSYPGDYLSGGPAGWIIAPLLPLGFLSPLILAWWFARRETR